MTATLERPSFDHHDVPQSQPRLVSRELRPEEITEVQKRRTDYLLERGLITEEALDEKGTIKDHFPDRSIWAGVSKSPEGELEAVGRVILTENGKIDSLQMPLDKIENPKTEIIEFLRGTSAAQVGEVASLLQEGSDPLAPLYEYAALYHASKERGITHWLFGLRRKSESGFQKIFGPALHKLGDSVAIEGAEEELSPYLIAIDQGVRDLRVSLATGENDRFTQMARQTFIDAVDQYEKPVLAA